MADIPVLQADRELAGTMYANTRGASEDVHASIIEGRYDEHPYVRRITRHRHDHTADLVAAAKDALDTLSGLKADLAEEDAARHAQRIAVIDLNIAALSRARNTPDPVSATPESDPKGL